MPTTLSLTYYPWITQSISGPALRQAIDEFRGLLEGQLRQQIGNDARIELQNAMEVPEQIADMMVPPSGAFACKIGLLNPIGYAIAHARTPAVRAVAVIRRKIGDEPAGPTYKAQLYSRKDSGIANVKDVRGRAIGYGSPQSTSNFLVPAIMLWEQGVHPLNGFARVEFTGGHDKAAMAVYQKRLEIGAGHDGVIFDLASKPGFEDANEVLGRIAWSESIPSDPVALNCPDDDLGKNVVRALLEMAKPNDGGSPGNQAVKKFWGTTEGFESISADAYGPLLRLMYPLGLRPDDMLRK